MPSAFVAVVMTREPRAGEVKTRLTAGGAFSPQQAAEVAAAMLECTVSRLARLGDVVLAVTPDGTGPRLAAALPGPAPLAVDQGPGDLGERLDHVWRAVADGRPVAFFGIDSPDVPAAILAEIPGALATHDAALGPTLDGGYWTLAARRHQPALLDHIDWGSGSVYDQTERRAREAGVSLRPLSPWPDVDDPDDVAALRRRLAGARSSDDALRRLARRLGEVCRRAARP